MADFQALQRYLQIPDKSLQTTLKKFTTVLPEWSAIIDASFVSDDMKMRYHALITSRATRLGLA